MNFLVRSSLGNVFLYFEFLGCYKRQEKQSHIYNRKNQKQIDQLRCQQTATIKRKAKIIQDVEHSGKIAATDKFRI